MEVTPLKKWMTPDEVADWVLFLTLQNRSMSGQNLLIDNGEQDLNPRFVWPTGTDGFASGDMKAYALEKGIIIADTKFEFGLDEEGNVVVGDEMLTPDSSRFWPADVYEPGHSEPSYDKQFARDWLKAHPDGNWTLPQEVVDRTIAIYLEGCERLTGSRPDKDKAQKKNDKSLRRDRYTSPFSERYASAEMQYIFSQEKKFTTWRRLWVALAETEMELGLERDGKPVVTREMIDELKSRVDDVNYADAERREREVRHDVMSHVYAYG